MARIHECVRASYTIKLIVTVINEQININLKHKDRKCKFNCIVYFFQIYYAYIF